MDWDPSTLDGNPATPDRVFLGNDGGMYRSDEQRRQRLVGEGRPTSRGTRATTWRSRCRTRCARPRACRTTARVQVVDAAGAAVSRPIPALTTNWNSSGGGDGHWNVIDPDRRHLLLHVLAGRQRLAQLLGPPRHGDRRRRSRRTSRSRRSAATGRTATRRTRRSSIDPNVPPLAADGTQPPNARLHGRRDDRPLAQPRADDDADLPAVTPAPTNCSDDPNAPDPSLPGKVPCDERRHRALRQPLRRDHGGRARQVGDAGPVRAGRSTRARTPASVWKTSDAGATLDAACRACRSAG